MRDPVATKARIHDAALRLFVEQGIAETSIRDLAHAARIAEGTLYRHYVSKDALVADLFTSNYAAYAHRLDELQRRHTGLRSKLQAMIADICGLFDSDPYMFRFLLLVQHQAMRFLKDDAASPVAVVIGVMREAIAAGELMHDDPRLAAATTMGIVLQPAVFLIYDRLDPPFAQHAAAIVRTCERALGLS